MEDIQIVELYFLRSEAAIAETEKKYGRFLRQLAYNILHCSEDSEEVTEDTYMKAWNSIPPTRPELLKCFLSRITRNLSVNRLKYYSAQRRSPEMRLLLSELDECISDPKAAVETSLEAKEIACVLNRFLGSLSGAENAMFLGRYFYAYSIAELAEKFSLPEHKVKYKLRKLRGAMRAALEREGIHIEQ